MGKTAGKDKEVEKSTYPALMGLEKAQAYAQELHDQAFAALTYFKSDNVLELQQISEFLLSRKSWIILDKGLMAPDTQKRADARFFVLCGKC